MVLNTILVGSFLSLLVPRTRMRSHIHASIFFERISGSAPKKDGTVISFLHVLPDDPTHGHVLCYFCRTPVTVADWVGPIGHAMSHKGHESQVRQLTHKGQLGRWMHHACLLWCPEVVLVASGRDAPRDALGDDDDDDDDKVEIVNSSVREELHVRGLRDAMRRPATCCVCHQTGYLLGQFLNPFVCFSLV